MSLAGNVGCIFASRLSTELHAKTSKTAELSSMTSRDNVIVMGTLFTIALPIFLAFLGFVRLLGTFNFSALFLVTYLITGALSVSSLEIILTWLDCGVVDIGILYFKGMLAKRI
jgi:cation transporter-like permease